MNTYKPTMYSPYFFRNDQGEVEELFWIGNDVDEEILRTRTVFKTKEEAGDENSTL